MPLPWSAFENEVVRNKVLEKALNRGKIDDAFTVFSEHFVILAQASKANARFVEGSLVMEKVDILGPGFLGRVGFDHRVLKETSVV